MRKALYFVALVVSVVSAGTVAPAPAGAEAPDLASGFGITVTGHRWISARTFEVDVSTPLVDPGAVNGPHRVRVTLPGDYLQRPTTRWPVLYLLHGGAGGSSAQWTTGGGAVEAITAGRPVITVMADGGKVGWFTNWVDQSRGAQRWADFYLTQLIPWIDANLRTVAARGGRAIAGLSMGGYGAVRLAQDRPDLFASVASFSGAVDLGDAAIRATVTEESVRHGLPAYGAFGNPFWPFDGTWNAQDPMRRAARLQGLQVLLYAGAGIHDADVLERTVGQATHRFSGALTTAGVPHLWWMYGRPGPSVPFGCDGGHNFGCWNFALDDALPRMLTVLQGPGPGPGPGPAPLVANGGFETGLAPWACSGRCGRDGGGLARTGTGNGWVRNTSGWNDLHQTITVAPNRTYRLTGWIRSSASTTDGYFGVRTPAGQVVGEQRFGRLDGYTQLTVDVASGPHTTLVLFAGLWATTDTWLHLDDVTLTPR
jgi:S-formylglutathione hydrolase FrmB